MRRGVYKNTAVPSAPHATVAPLKSTNFFIWGEKSKEDDQLLHKL